MHAKVNKCNFCINLPTFSHLVKPFSKNYKQKGKSVYTVVYIQKNTEPKNSLLPITVQEALLNPLMLFINVAGHG